MVEPSAQHPGVGLQLAFFDFVELEQTVNRLVVWISKMIFELTIGLII